MRGTMLRLLGVLTIFAISISACNSIEEEKAWNKCIKTTNNKDKENCMLQFEKKFYPDSIYNDEELNWSDIDWNYTP